MWILLLGLGIILIALAIKNINVFGDPLNGMEASDPYQKLTHMRQSVQKALHRIEERNPISNLPISQAERVTLERCEAMFLRFLRIVHDPVQPGDLRDLTRTYGSLPAVLGTFKRAIHDTSRILLIESTDVTNMKRQVHRTETLIDELYGFIQSPKSNEVLSTIDEDMRRSIPRKLDEFQRRLNAIDIDTIDTLSIYDQNRIHQEVFNISEDVAFLSAILKLENPLSITEDTYEEGFQSGGNPYAQPRDLPSEPDQAIAEKSRKVYFREPLESLVLASPALSSRTSPAVLQGQEYKSDLPTQA